MWCEFPLYCYEASLACALSVEYSRDPFQEMPMLLNIKASVSALIVSEYGLNDEKIHQPTAYIGPWITKGCHSAIKLEPAPTP